MLTFDAPGLSDDPETFGEAWLVQADAEGDSITLEPRGPLTRGVVSGVLLGSPPVGDESTTAKDPLPPLAWEPPADYPFTLRSACGHCSDLGRYEIVVEDGRTTSVETSLRVGGQPRTTRLHQRVRR